MFRRLLAPALILVLSSLAAAQPLTTAFTFQGALSNAGAPVNGTYDAQFRLFDAPTGGTQLGPTLCVDNASLANGQFTTQLDFGSQFAGDQRFLEVSIRQDTGLTCSNSTGFTTLSPRQQLTATPNAVYALNAASAATAATAQSANIANAANTAALATNATQLNGQIPAFYLNAANLSAGTLPDARLGGTYSSLLNLSNASNVFAGSGASLTGLSAGNVAAGTLADARLSSNVPLLNLSNTFTGTYNLFSAVSINTAPSSGFDLAVDGPALVQANGDVGDALRIGGAAIAMGLTTEIGADTPLLNLDVNFRTSTVDTSYKGGAVRIDTRATWPTIQFLTRAAGDTAEKVVMSVDDNGIGFWETPQTNELVRINKIGYTGNTLVAVSDGSFRAAITGINEDLFNGRGVIGESAGPAGIGVLGELTSSVGNGGIGVEGWVTAPNTTGVLGYNSSTTWGTGLEGRADGTGQGPNGTNAYGVVGLAASHSSASRAIGVYGESDGLQGVGVYGTCDPIAGGAYGVYGGNHSGNGFGVYSNGNMGASGLKPFRIDHPADPEHKYLLHYCTESPEVLNAYSGKVTLNQQGEATVDLPAYFARINKDPRYTLTPVGAAMPLLHVADEVSDDALEQGAKAAPQDAVPTCSFTIAGGAPNAKVCWRVEAVRNDRWVQVHGAPVEVKKEGPEDGTYQHPDLYNQPAEMGMNFGTTTR